VTFDRPSGGRLEARLHVHTAPLHADDVVMVHGLVVTSVARTVVDVARRAPFEAAVTVADAALRSVLGDVPARRTEYGTTATSDSPDSTAGLRDAGRAAAVPQALPAVLDAAVRRAKGWPGVPAARQVLAFADGRSESVGESRSRVAIARAGLPSPVPQFPVRLARGVAYSDFGWPQHRTVGEFDGKVKYGRLLRPGQDPGDAVFEEKLREDAIRARGWEVVRWTWTDLPDFTDTAVRIRDRFRG
jgi:hypothetical protein